MRTEPIHVVFELPHAFPTNSSLLYSNIVGFSYFSPSTSSILAVTIAHHSQPKIPCNFFFVLLLIPSTLSHVLKRGKRCGTHFPGLVFVRE